MYPIGTRLNASNYSLHIPPSGGPDKCTGAGGGIRVEKAFLDFDAFNLYRN
jgi:hypothetical protein